MRGKTVLEGLFSSRYDTTEENSIFILLTIMGTGGQSSMVRVHAIARRVLEETQWTIFSFGDNFKNKLILSSSEPLVLLETSTAFQIHSVEYFGHIIANEHLHNEFCEVVSFLTFFKCLLSTLGQKIKR